MRSDNHNNSNSRVHWSETDNGLVRKPLSVIIFVCYTGSAQKEFYLFRLFILFQIIFSISNCFAPQEGGHYQITEPPYYTRIYVVNN